MLSPCGRWGREAVNINVTFGWCILLPSWTDSRVLSIIGNDQRLIFDYLFRPLELYIILWYCLDLNQTVSFKRLLNSESILQS